MASSTDYAWAAGFIDGEGCFYAARQKNGAFVAKIAVTQKQILPLDRLSEIFGYGVTARRSDNRCWVWTVDGRKRIIPVLDAIEPYLVAKSDQAALLRMLCETITGDRNPDWDTRLKLISELRDAKNYGIPVP